MARGDHLVVNYGFYSHHGIDVGDGTVIELSKTAGIVRRIPFQEFADGRPVCVRPYEECDPRSVVIRRALERVGEGGYDLLANNCEHFATWCKTGYAESHQVQTVARRSSAVLTKVAAASAARAVAKSGSRAAAKAMTRAASPLLMSGMGQLASAVARTTVTKVAAASAARAVAKSGSRAAATGIMRAASPWLLLADAGQLVTEVTLTNMGADPAKAATAGRCVGVVGTVALGAAVGGPIGAAGGLAIWMIGEVVGSMLSASPTEPERSAAPACPNAG